MEYPILIDFWEGSGDPDEQLLLNNGIAGLIPRLNAISGGLHKDDNFDTQWRQSAVFPIRSTYLVYNPWVTGIKNYDFFMSIIPSDMVGRIFIDIEVIYTGYSPVTYAQEVEKFKRLMLANFDLDIYTGAWFLPYLAYWPGDVDYWWARYPLSLYPATSTPISWDELKAKVYATPYNPDYYNTCPNRGHIPLWQCSADRYKPPGCASRAVDINILNMTLDQGRAYFKMPSVPILRVPIAQYLDQYVDPFIRGLGYTGPKPEV